MRRLEAPDISVLFDWKESLLTGAPVFRSSRYWIRPCGPRGSCGAAAGLHRLGSSWYTTGGRSHAQTRGILAHETIHLTQFVRDAILFAVPAGDAVLRTAGGSFARIGTVVSLDAFLPVTLLNQGLSMTMPAEDDGSWRLYEFEARAFSGTR